MESELKIRKIKNRKDLYCIEPVYLNCVLMNNNEIIFNGKSLGFVSDEEIEKWGYTAHYKKD